MNCTARDIKAQTHSLRIYKTHWHHQLSGVKILFLTVVVCKGIRFLSVGSKNGTNQYHFSLSYLYSHLIFCVFDNRKTNMRYFCMGFQKSMTFTFRSSESSRLNGKSKQKPQHNFVLTAKPLS